MTPEQITALAKEAGATTYTNRHYPGETAMAFSNGRLLDFVKLIEANTREACAKIVEQETYPGGDDDDLIRPYNIMIKNLAEQIRRME